MALKGLGGFHLICDARNEAAVARLRLRKAREAKPFAVMVANAASAGRFARGRRRRSGRVRTSPRAPMVLMRKRAGRACAPPSRPASPHVGLMLAYTPLHWLILHALAGKPEFAPGATGLAASRWSPPAPT